MHGRHTSQAILAEYEKLLQDWEIPSKKVSRIMTDGGSNMVAAGFDQISGWESGEMANESMQENQLPSQTEAAEKPDSEEVFIELEIDGSLMDSMDDLAAELKQFAVQDLDTHEELEERE
ncbi:hypothetical protein DAPPUDRAFT_111143 [Daphnia pulex]|uniref:DUF659 domain-containing protein n=1 Tax=Daphnia pulex TaxID=6669 RepID=E9H895_DAPPU|nr:hypothetical protein DAPPUDRAFT_111143 [Daphnia pulex]|eukprot:EFX72066.1 hypothetical protein DAPPUDRAFT_111143 [Daphnia pulex]